MSGFLNRWKANSVRFTVFPVEFGAASTIAWREFTGLDPESDEARPRENVRRQTGTLDKVQLALTASLDRLDLMAMPVASVPQGAVYYGGPAISDGSFNDLFSEFHALFNTWLGRCPFAVKRIAVGGVALIGAESPNESYKVLNELIQAFTVKFGEMSDLSYRVNRRVPPKQASLPFYNRLTAFASVGFTAVSPIPYVAQALPTECFTSLDVDLNTPAERNEALPVIELLPISNELASLLRENLDQGECLVRSN